MSAGWQAVVSRQNANPMLVHDFHRSLTSHKSKVQEMLAGLRKWVTKSLRLG
jgi:hypothetical protein